MLRKMFFSQDDYDHSGEWNSDYVSGLHLVEDGNDVEEKYKISALQANGWILAEINMRNGLPTCPNTGTSMRATNTRVLK